MQTGEAPDFWRLHKSKNCAFPLNVYNLLINYLNLIKECIQKQLPTGVL